MKLVSKNTLLAAMLAVTSYGVFAADSVDLRVIGTIVPASCTPTISGGGIVDFGHIPAASLSATDFTNAGTKQVNLTISCDSAAKVAISTLDNRSATAVPGLGTFLVARNYGFGVGAVDGKNVGTYEIEFTKGAATADGVAVNSIYEQNASGSWTDNGASYKIFGQPGIRTHSWAPAGTTTPGSFQTITQSMNVTLGLNKRSDLPALNQEVPIDGLATFSLVYL